MKLNNFSYYFSVKGNKGGIFSISFEFIPGRIAEPPYITKEQVRDDFEQLESILDSLFVTNTHIRGEEKAPILSDSPSGLETGFEYKGRKGKMMETASRGLLDAFLSIILPNRLHQPKLDSSLMDSFITLSAKLCCHIRKGNENQTPPVLKLEIQVGHDLNLHMFESLISLPELDVSPQAEREIQHLRQILNTGKQIDPKKYLGLEA
ncbi:MAG: hypothetical protein HQM04_19145 [Magnetococcales bacterium]|nr:hypothetical protein [Magnetococcales bacterium]MBF0117144.1 hypothetical protein [Magnetococcales bacterium]